MTVQSPGLSIYVDEVDVCFCYDGLQALGYPEDDPFIQRIYHTLEIIDDDDDGFALELQPSELHAFTSGLDYLLGEARDTYFDSVELLFQCQSLRDRLPA